MERSDEAAAIMTTHGFGDALTTIAAASVVGPQNEANPIVRELLAHGDLVTAVVMLVAVAVGSVLWAVGADAADAPPVAGWAVATLGAVVVANNLVVILI